MVSSFLFVIITAIKRILTVISTIIRGFTLSERDAKAYKDYQEIKVVAGNTI